MKLIYFNDIIYCWGILVACIIGIVWEWVWKFIALWKAARNNHLGWFVCIILVNTAGILPIIYILMQKKIGSNEK